MLQFLKNIFHEYLPAEEKPAVKTIGSRVKDLEIKSKKLTNHLFTGEYHSAFKGRGMAFKEVKEYSAGDDIRFIDWNVSARMGSTYSKVFEEERELSVYILIDASASGNIGSAQHSKRELMNEIAAVLAFSAVSNNDKVGFIFYTNVVEKYIPSAKGREHVLYMVRELITFSPKEKQTNLVKALQYLNRITRQKSIVFILSDFADDGYQDALRIAAKKHDVIGIQVFDSVDASLPNVGLLHLEDAETGKQTIIDTSSLPSKAAYNKQYQIIVNDTAQIFKRAAASIIQLQTNADFVKALQQFFIKRI